MLVTIHQPDFLPWLGFFDRWRQSDLYIVLDDVQFIRRGWHHRDKIKTTQGATWLTIPVLKKGRYQQSINEVRIQNAPDWRPRFLNVIRHAYEKAPCFETVYSELTDILDLGHERLMDLNVSLLRYCAAKLAIATPVIFSSGLKICARGTERLVKLVKAVNGSAYLTGLGSKDYLEASVFAGHGIEIKWQTFDHPVYPQIHGEFQKKLSILDFLMMMPDPSEFLKLIRPNGKPSA